MEMKFPALSSFYLDPPTDTLSRAPPPNELVNILSKEEYETILRKKRMEFIHSHFSSELTRLFNDMKNDAVNMKPSHRECEFTVPEPFDQNKIEKMLKDYFIDLGYKPIVEDKKVESSDGKKVNKIMMTIT